MILNIIKKYSVYIVIISIVLIYIITINNGHTWHDDFALYLKQAESLCKFDFTDLINKQTFLQAESSRTIAANFAPWGYPLLIAPVYCFLGLNLFVFKIYNVLFFGLFLLIVYKLFEDELGKHESLLIISLISFSPAFFDFKDMVYSEFPFMFFSVLCLILIKRLLIDKRSVLNVYFSFILLSISMFITFMIREVGILLYLSLFIVQILEMIRLIKSGKYNEYFKVSYVFFNILPYILFVFLFILQLKLLPFKSQSNFLNYSIIWGQLQNYYVYYLSFFKLNAVSIILLILTIILFIICCKERFQKYLYIYSFILSYFGVLLIYEGIQGIRYLMPVIPFVLYLSYIGGKTVAIKYDLYRPYKYGLLLIFSVLIIRFLSLDILSIKENYGKTLDGPFSEEFVEVQQFVSTKTPESSIVTFEYPRAMYYLSKRYSIWNYNLNSLSNKDNSYVVFMKNQKHPLKQPQKAEELNLLLLSDIEHKLSEMVFQNRNFTIFKIKSYRN